MTLDEIRMSDKPCLIPTDISDVLGCNPKSIRVQAQNGTLPFPCFTSGRITRIPREAFIAWMEGRLNKNE